VPANPAIGSDFAQEQGTEVATSADAPPAGGSAGVATDRPPRRLDRFSLAVAAVVAGQAVWSAVLMAQGWYYEADFSNLAAATGRPLTWGYLSQSQGGHLDVLGRAVFWLLNRVAPLNYPLTIGLRVLAQAYATYLLARLLVLLVGRRPGLPCVLVLYAVSPLMVQSVLWLTSSVNFLLSQIFVLWALLAHVRYSLTRRFVWAGATAAAMFAATLVAEQAAVAALALPILSLGFLHAGTARQRLVATLRSWPEWALVAGPIAVFVLFFLGSGRYDNGHLHVGVHAFAVSVWQEWTATILPAMIGGPFRWYAAPGQYFSLADPSAWTRVLAAVVVALFVAHTVRRTGARALLAWAIPLLVGTVGIMVVAVGRYAGFGSIIARQYEHAAFVAVPLALGTTLALWRAEPERIRARLAPVPAAEAGGRSRRASRHAHRRPVAAAVLSAAVLAASLVSAGSYTQRWSEGPSRAFVDNLRANLRAAGPTVNLFDTEVPATVMPAIADYRRISDLLPLLGASAHYNRGHAPRIVDSRGGLRPAVFLSSAAVDTGGSNAFCNDVITSTGVNLQVLVPRPRRNEWFVKLSYFEQFPSVVYVQAVDGHRRVDPVGGARVLLADRLGTVYLRLPSSSPTALVVRGGSPSTRVCITALTVGYPFPAGSGS
jgi:hypothetical protein